MINLDLPKPKRQGQKVALPFYKVSQILYISRLIDGSHILLRLSKKSKIIVLGLVSG